VSDQAHHARMSAFTVPIWHEVDLLVVGGTTAAVAGALEAASSGLRVALVADETYLGQDLAGAFQLWPDEKDPLIAEAFAASGGVPARPAALKRALESALLRAGIPFLYGCQPVGILRDTADAPRGAVFAARTALFAVRAPRILDASLFGSVARLAGLATVARPDPAPVRWRVLASREPSGWQGAIRTLEPAYVQTLKDGPQSYSAFELSIDRTTLGADPRELEHAARATLCDEAVWVAADHLIECGGRSIAARPAGDTPADLSDACLHPAEGIWMANRLLPVGHAAALTDPWQMAAAGRRAARLAVSESAAAESPSGSPLRLATGGSAVSGLRFSEAFLRSDRGSVAIDVPAFAEWDAVDVVVAGGGTGGAPAAIAAARAGARTLCLETAHGLGGVGTLGLISSYWFGNKCGFTAELTDRLTELDAISRAKRGNAWHPGVKSGLYHRLLREAGGAAWLGSMVCGVLREGNRPAGVLVATPHGCGFVPAKRFIDATGNADLAAATGADCRLIDRTHVAVQGTGISPRVHPSVPHQNADHTFIDDNDPEGITLAHAQTRAKYPADFETMPFVNSRERRQIRGDLEISPLDILAGRTFPDTLFTASSNFDTHGFIVHPVFMVVPPDHKALRAHVPLRCMLPQGIEGLLVTGLGMSAHRDALPVIRMQADVQNQGYAAGLLAARTARTGEDLRAVDVKAFQQELVAQGILTPETAADADSFPMSAEAVAEAADGPLDNARDVAILFAHPALTRERLRAIVETPGEPGRRLRAALILGLSGYPEAGPFLREQVAASTWDEGWDYRGMGQFGPSMSVLDATLLALARTRDPGAAPVLVPLALALDATAAFSHCRSLALATACLRDPALASALGRLLDLPGFAGHAFVEPSELLADSDDSPISTRSRNLSLRELYVARGLFLSGDPEGKGRAILERYARDLRGHFARHAQAVLAAGPDHATDPLAWA